MQPELFNQLARSRRSVFPDQYESGKPVEDAIINEILLNASWAPNHGRTEPWQFTVFSGDGLHKLAEFQSSLYKEIAGENFKEATYIKLQQTPLKASHIIAIGMKRSSLKNIPEIEDIEAVACAVQNIYLSVTAYGLGGYWTTGGLPIKKKLNPFLAWKKRINCLDSFILDRWRFPL